MNALTLLTCGVLLDGASVCSNFFGTAMTFLLSVVLAFRLVLAVVTALNARLTIREAVARWRRWLVTPITLAVVLGVCDLRLPFLLRFELSRASLTKFGREMLANPPSKTTWFSPGKMVGFMPVTCVDANTSEVWAQLGIEELGGTRIEMVLSPQHMPRLFDYQRRESLGGDWYLVVR